MDTAQQILDIAEGLVQTRGFNGFSYADISEALKIRKPSIHHHFPTKAELGRRLITRYHETVNAKLAVIDHETSNCRTKLERYARIYARVLRNNNRMCLCGMLAADFYSLPAEIRDELRSFFEANEAWLARVLKEGQKGKTLHFSANPRLEARLLLSSLQGAMLVARSFDDASRFEAIAKRLIAAYEA